jgi:hypothetical protein
MTKPDGSNKRRVLFHRDFQRFTGGHLKVWDYFNHVAASPDCEPRISFTVTSKWDGTNPWEACRNAVVPWNTDNADILFLGGLDWRAVAEPKRRRFSKPIINLVQHVRHAEPGSELRGFLKNRAIRICPSQQTADAINGTGEVNGPVFVIPYGIDLRLVSEEEPNEGRAVEVFIGGLKMPKLANQIYRALIRAGDRLDCLTDFTPRDAYIERLRAAKVAVVLPRTTEGFYLPALEAMACGAIVVCPDCIGNRDFCHDKMNCFRPEHSFREIVSAAKRARDQSKAEQDSMRQQAKATVRKHSMEAERTSFLSILDRVDELWNG